MQEVEVGINGENDSSELRRGSAPSSSELDRMGMELFGLGARFDLRWIAQEDFEGRNRTFHGIFERILWLLSRNS